MVNNTQVRRWRRERNVEEGVVFNEISSKLTDLCSRIDKVGISYERDIKQIQDGYDELAGAARKATNLILKDSYLLMFVKYEKGLKKYFKAKTPEQNVENIKARTGFLMGFLYRIYDLKARVLDKTGKKNRTMKGRQPFLGLT